MAVLVEAISVIIKKTSIEQKFRGGWSVFKENIPNQTLCDDDILVRIGFMSPYDVGGYIQYLERNGLTFLRSKQAVDLVVVDQLRGPTTPCDWIKLGYIRLSEHGIQLLAAGICEADFENLDVPDGWTEENSISASPNFIPNGKTRDELEYLRTENGIKVFKNKRTGKEVFLASDQDPEELA